MFITKNKKIGIIILIAIASISIPVISASHIPYDVENYCDNIIIKNNHHKFNFMCDFAVDHEQRLDALESITVVNGTDGIDGTDGINGVNGTDGIDGVNGTTTIIPNLVTSTELFTAPPNVESYFRSYCPDGTYIISGGMDYTGTGPKDMQIVALTPYAPDNAYALTLYNSGSVSQDVYVFTVCWTP